MEKMPALSVKDGKAVVIKNEDYLPVGDPVKMMRNLKKDGYEKFYILDIEGIERNRMQINLIERLPDEFNIWVDAGFRDVGGVEDALILGAKIAVIGTKSIRSLEEVKKAVELSENIAVSVDHFYGILKWGDIPGDFDSIAEPLRDWGVDRIVFSNLGGFVSWKDVIGRFRDFELWLGGNLPEKMEFEGVYGIIVPYSKLSQS